MNAVVLFYLMGGLGIILIALLFKRYAIAIFWSTTQICSLPRHRYHYHGLENIPDDKAVLLLGNHVSWLDWIILQLPIERKINYMMDKNIYHWPYLHIVFKTGEAIPISPKGFKDAFNEAHRRLQNGNIVALFPEGEITKNGKLGEFHRGFELIPHDYDGVIVPFYIGSGIFGSLFAKYKPKNIHRSLFRLRHIDIYFGKALPEDTTAEELKKIIQKMKETYET
jgi:acyl-[acyl-carrier-protein]-phospholipid O-acyltransferase/long-chain-fatty-acid--[acyl-carrier-protein] ligase